MAQNTILGSNEYIEFLRGKSATFLLSMSVTKTCEIEGITQAGIPGLIHLTPTLDAEFLATGEVKSLPNIASTPKGVPSPALLTRCVHLLKPFKNIEFLNLGLEVKPTFDYFEMHEQNINPSGKISENAKINAIEIFEKGVEFGREYKCKSDYFILGESVPSGTSTAYASLKALGYDVDNKMSSSFKDVPNDIRKETIQKALLLVDNNMDIFDKLSIVGDNMLIFNAGFVLGNSSTDTKMVLAGGTQMAAVLLIVNSILKVMGGEIDSKNLALVTTKWVANDKNSDIKALLSMLDFPINAYYSDFDFTSANNKALKLYDDGEAKEGVGAGGALLYGLINGLTKAQIVSKCEELLSIASIME